MKTAQLPASSALLCKLDPDGRAETLTVSAFQLSDGKHRLTVTGGARWTHAERDFKTETEAGAAFDALTAEKELTAKILSAHGLRFV